MTATAANSGAANIANSQQLGGGSAAAGLNAAERLRQQLDEALVEAEMLRGAAFNGMFVNVLDVCTRIECREAETFSQEKRPP